MGPKFWSESKLRSKIEILLTNRNVCQK